MAEPFRIALAQYPIGRPPSLADYERKLEEWVAAAAGEGGRLLVFPEYGGMELASLFGPEVEGDLQRQIDAIDGIVGAVDDLHASLARRLGVYVLAASLPVKHASLPGLGPVNRARLFGPEGGRGRQDKRIMTRFEREQWGVRGGDGLAVFDTGLGPIGVVLCYDIEFPLIARALVEAGANLLLVPSCTDTVAGCRRVRVGAMARALENQCLVAVSPTVGVAPWSPAVDVNIGAAGLYGPPDRGFPDTGVLVEGVRDEPGWVYAEVDPARIAEAREQGQVFNHRDWAAQPGIERLAPMPVHRIRVD
jgi:predicted amidohydrolase